MYATSNTPSLRLVLGLFYDLYIPLRRYCGMLRWVDEAVGNLSTALQGNGMWADTLMVVSSDNGGL